jgi:hypothetical protein
MPIYNPNSICRTTALKNFIFTKIQRDFKNYEAKHNTSIRRRYEIKFLQTSKRIIQQLMLMTIPEALAKAIPTYV